MNRARGIDYAPSRSAEARPTDQPRVRASVQKSKRRRRPTKRLRGDSCRVFTFSCGTPDQKSNFPAQADLWKTLHRDESCLEYAGGSPVFAGFDPQTEAWNFHRNERIRTKLIHGETA